MSYAIDADEPLGFSQSEQSIDQQRLSSARPSNHTHLWRRGEGGGWEGGGRKEGVRDEGSEGRRDEVRKEEWREGGREGGNR